jgi:hypothetical protein
MERAIHYLPSEKSTVLLALEYYSRKRAPNGTYSIRGIRVYVRLKSTSFNRLPCILSMNLWFSVHMCSHFVNYHNSTCINNTLSRPCGAPALKNKKQHGNRGRCQHRRPHVYSRSNWTSRSAERISTTIPPSIWACTGRSRPLSPSAGALGVLTRYLFAWRGSRQSVEPVAGRFVDAFARLQDERDEVVASGVLRRFDRGVGLRCQSRRGVTKTVCPTHMQVVETHNCVRMYGRCRPCVLIFHLKVVHDLYSTNTRPTEYIPYLSCAYSRTYPST